MHFLHLLVFFLQISFIVCFIPTLLILGDLQVEHDTLPKQSAPGEGWGGAPEVQRLQAQGCAGAEAPAERVTALTAVRG